MNHKALVVIDIQNDITKHYRDIIDRLNAAIEWAVEPVPSSRAQKEQNLCRSSGLSRIIFFVKTKANALTSEAFSEFIRSNDIREFYITGADATACARQEGPFQSLRWKCSIRMYLMTGFIILNWTGLLIWKLKAVIIL